MNSSYRFPSPRRPAALAVLATLALVAALIADEPKRTEESPTAKSIFDLTNTSAFSIGTSRAAEIAHIEPSHQFVLANWLCVRLSSDIAKTPVNLDQVTERDFYRPSVTAIETAAEPHVTRTEKGTWVITFTTPQTTDATNPANSR